MRSYRNPFSRFGQSLMISREEIEDACCDALNERDLMPAEPGAVDIERFIEKHFQLHVEYRNDLGAGVLGCTQFDTRGKPVRVIIGDTEEDPSESYERRIRSTLAHEGGHALLHPILFMSDGSQQMDIWKGESENIDFSQSRILCRGDDLSGKTSKGRYDGRWWEWQANQAIGGFLMPRKLVMALLDDLLQKGVLTGVGTLSPGHRDEATQRLVDTFDVNPAAAKVRINVLFPKGESHQMMF